MNSSREDYFKVLHDMEFEEMADELLTNALNGTRVAINDTEDVINLFYNNISHIKRNILFFKPLLKDMTNNKNKFYNSKASGVISIEKLQEHVLKLNKLDEDIEAFKTRIIELMNKL